MKKQTAATFYKNTALQEHIVKSYKASKLNFKIKHSNYNTHIIGEVSTIKFIQKEHSIKVFIAYNKIVKDLKASSRTQEILDSDYSTENFDSKNGLAPCSYKKIVNLDITSAYPFCLHINNLITTDTFNYLMKLPKTERLPAIGMIAKKSNYINYVNGIATTWDLKVGPYANIFYYIIKQINDLMKYVADIAGEDFIFFWVDGIFLRPSITKTKLEDIIAVFDEQGYTYKYENVENFCVQRIGEKLVIKMVKNGKDKTYQMYDKNLARNFMKLLEKLEDEKNPLDISRATA
jgi:hypothetical protein